MTGGWQRLGALALDTAAAPWAVSHAALPVLDPLDDGRWSIFLSLRDAMGRARIGRATLSLTPAPRLGPLDPTPVLDLGALGAFDDSGVTSSCLVSHEGRKYLFFTGWSRAVTVPFYLAVGIAASDDGRTFRRTSEGPLLDRNAIDPYLTASPFVLVESGRWKMWYVSGTGWSATAAGPRHAYHVRYAESSDPFSWKREGIVCLDYSRPEEHAFSRVSVLREQDGYHMWFASRGDRYAIGYATSRDGCSWHRRDAAAGLQPAPSGWDSEMVAYPFVFSWRGRRYMLYNGNDYGKSGVGLAVWDSL